VDEQRGLKMGLLLIGLQKPTHSPPELTVVNDSSHAFDAVKCVQQEKLCCFGHLPVDRHLPEVVVVRKEFELEECGEIVVGSVGLHGNIICGLVIEGRCFFRK
jgi:hypothetical protein